MKHSIRGCNGKSRCWFTLYNHDKPFLQFPRFLWKVIYYFESRAFFHLIIFFLLGTLHTSPFKFNLLPCHLQGVFEGMIYPIQVERPLFLRFCFKDYFGFQNVQGTWLYQFSYFLPCIFFPLLILSSYSHHPLWPWMQSFTVNHI